MRGVALEKSAGCGAAVASESCGRVALRQGTLLTVLIVEPNFSFITTEAPQPWTAVVIAHLCLK
jgi:hypothetical protein